MRCGARCGPGGERAVDLRWRKRHARGRLESRLGGKAPTANMPPMFVTLDVSQLSGWLNAGACCRVEGRAYDVGRGAGREAGGCGAAACTRGRGPTQVVGSRARAERTENMFAMSVTLYASKFSGWLNADAYCRVEGRACGAERAIGGRVWGGGGASGHARGKDPAQDLGGRARAERT